MARDLAGSHRGFTVGRGKVLYVGSAWFSSGVMFAIEFAEHFDLVELRHGGHHDIV